MEENEKIQKNRLKAMVISSIIIILLLVALAIFRV